MKTFYLSMLTILWLTGCAGYVHQMVKEDGVPFTAGELVHDRGENNRLVLEMSNRRYEAHGFAVERQTHWAELRKRYYSSHPKHWDRIFSGLSTEHVVYSFETVARSAEGYEVSCRLVWKSGAQPAGVCTDQEGTAFTVRFDQH
ncbi:MAG: hypothetical protein Q7J38_14590 [Gallionella sp.]|nr:hypothetical protein [Gallionella sp.]